VTLVVRPARPDEVDAIVALVQSAYRGESSRRGWTTEAELLDGQRTDAQEVRETLPHLLVAERDGAMVGVCALQPHDDEGHFGMFAVTPDLQGGGVGSVLLSAAEERARGLGLARVTMWVLWMRRELIAFYERRGYVDTGKRIPWPHTELRFGLPRRPDLEFVLMAKDL
jgi:N-acetylglutamate synthase-like GNAT family acetyltransferase